MEPIRQDPENFLKEKVNIPIADVRTPLEYSRGHIPGATLFPLFSNEERAEVGKLYALYGHERAIERGYELAGQKLKYYLNEAFKLASGSRLAIYCWRGGMRSASIAWLLGFAGFRIHILDGGYRAYRRYCRTSFSKSARIIIVGGYTGSGKTEILHSLEKRGEQVINLEALSHHKGSAFGWIGENSQPSQEQFENNLADQWQKLDLSKNIWIEDESINIGRIQVPRPIFTQMELAPVIIIETEKKQRIQRLVKDYQWGTKEDLILVFNRISKRIGSSNSKQAIEAIEKNELQFAAEIALVYYDKTYAELLKKRHNQHCYSLEYNDNPNILGDRILDCGRKIYY
jgi:tRNA 2-selenouridine synthase